MRYQGQASSKWVTTVFTGIITFEETTTQKGKTSFGDESENGGT